MAKKIIDVAALSQAAIKYDSVLRTLPYFTLEEVAKSLRLNIQLVENEHVIVNKRRLAGGTGPYKQGMTIDYKEEIAKFFESSLKPELTVCKTKDNIQNYKEKYVLVVAGNPLDQKSKKHPLERMIIESEVISHGEDVAFSLFFAERDEDVFSPMTAFTGFFPAMDMLVAEGYIAVSEKNMQTTGTFRPNPTDATEYDKLVDFIGLSHPLLRSSAHGLPQLMSAQSVMKSVRDSLRKKLNLLEYPTMQRTIEHLREDSFCPGLVWDTHESLGTGSKLVFQKAGNMDIGMNTGRSDKFMRVRDPFEDPNEVQFWLQAAYGVRIQDVHQKKFKTNEQENIGADLAGDYVAP